MKTFKITLGPASEGRHKDTNKRHFRSRLSTGSFLEVQENKEQTLTVNEVDESMLQNLDSRGFIQIAEAATQTAQAVRQSR
jgi:hypothetical protein